MNWPSEGEFPVSVDLEMIKRAQAAGGGILASANYPAYNYCWFRDGAFAAYALDLWGEHDRAAAFHQWAANIVGRRAESLDRAALAARNARDPDPADLLHARYGDDGREGHEPWWNHQLDGSGVWLWALAEHLRLSRRRPSVELLRAAGQLAFYLDALARTPCADCWEENPEGRHTSSQAAVAAGLSAASRMGAYEPGLARSAELVGEVKWWARNGLLSKSFGREELDASLLWLGAPWEVLAADDPLWVATLEAIRGRLRRPGGGVYRYLADTFYGGGEWILLAGWLAINLARAGEEEEADELITWIDSTRLPDGALPEQVTTHALHPEETEEWVTRWGKVAAPLTWSHATRLTAQALMMTWGTER